MVVAAIVADDLTGACDATAPFLAAGCTVTVGLGTMPSRDADVVALSTETRNAGPGEAAVAIAAAVSSVADVPVSALLKKLDSRLRGPVGIELASALRASGAPYCVLAPALPREGRVVERGVLRPGDGHAVPIAARLDETASLAVAVVPAATDPDRLAAAIADAGARADVVVCDARMDEHLCAVAAGVAQVAPAPLLAGTSGLAGALAGRVVPPGVPRRRPAALNAERILFVLGSLQPALRRQAEHLLAQRSVRCLALEDAAGAHAAAPPGSVMLESIRTGGAVDGGATARQLGAAAAGLLGAARFDAIVCSGGSVAAAVCRELDVHVLALVGELAPGFPLARIDGPAGPALFALRSGGFGSDDELVVACDRLSGGPA